MVAKIRDYSPPKHIAISEYCNDDPNKGFPHNIDFHIDWIKKGWVGEHSLLNPLQTNFMANSLLQRHLLYVGH